MNKLISNTLFGIAYESQLPEASGKMTSQYGYVMWLKGVKKEMMCGRGRLGRTWLNRFPP